MKTTIKPRALALALATALATTTSVLVAHTALAQDAESDSRALRMAAIEALMMAPPERALPLVKKLLASEQDKEIKARALFILGQIDLPEAHEAILEFARNESGELQLEAIRTIGISGDPELTSGLGDLYRNGDARVRRAVLEAWMIAGDEDSVFEVAANAGSDEEFEAAVHQLGVMGATDRLAELRDRPGMSESLVQAFAIAGDTESLEVMARDASDSERQLAALRGLGIAGGPDDPDFFVEIYQGTDDPAVKDAVRQGILVAGDEESALRLFKAARNDREKAELLRLLVIMDSDAAFEAIDEALGGDGQ